MITVGLPAASPIAYEAMLALTGTASTVIDEVMVAQSAPASPVYDLEMAVTPPLPPPPIPGPPPPAPPPAPEPVVVAGALVVTPTTVLVTDRADSTGDALNRYGATVLRGLAIRQAGATTQRYGRFTGPAYQFGPSWALTLGPKSDLEVVFTSVVNILTTPLGTIPYDPFIGSEIPNLVFEPNDSVTQGLISYFVVRDLGRQEPRVNVVGVNTVVPVNEPHTVIITVAFQIVGDSEGRVFSAPIAFNTLRLAA